MVKRKQEGKTNMRRVITFLLMICMVFTALPALGESPTRDRGSIQVVNEEIEGEMDELEEIGLYNEDDAVVFDPIEELQFDEESRPGAFDTLDGMRNILLLGVDSRSKAISGRTDSMILLSVDIEGKVIKMTSFLRDTYVEIPGKSNNRLNSAYVFGGYDLLARTLEKNFGVKPDAYVMVNLRGLTRIIDQLGGVYVNVDAKKIDRINAVIYWYNQEVLGLSNPRDGYLTKGGYQKLNGKQAESWARYRYSETDMKRAERQRELIQIIFEEICKMDYGDLVSFAMNNMDLVKTNLSLSEIIALAPAVLALKDAEIRELQIHLNTAYQSKTVSGMAVLVPDRNKNAKALADFLKAK